MNPQNNQITIKGRNNGTLTPWQPGQSGNPAGRPPGPSSALILNQLLEGEVDLSHFEPATMPQRVTLRHLAMMRLVQLAMGYKSPNGRWVEPSLRAIIEIVDRLEGKPTQKHQYSADSESSICPNITKEVAMQVQAFIDECCEEE